MKARIFIFVLALSSLACVLSPTLVTPAPTAQASPTVAVVLAVSTSAPVCLEVTAVQALWVRSAPVADAPTLGVVGVGEVLAPTGVTAPGWVQVWLNGGGTGWVSGKYVREVACE